MQTLSSFCFNMHFIISGLLHKMIKWKGSNGYKQHSESHILSLCHYEYTIPIKTNPNKIIEVTGYKNSTKKIILYFVEQTLTRISI